MKKIIFFLLVVSTLSSWAQEDCQDIQDFSQILALNLTCSKRMSEAMKYKFNDSKKVLGPLCADQSPYTPDCIIMAKDGGVKDLNSILIACKGAKETTPLCILTQISKNKKIEDCAQTNT